MKELSGPQVLYDGLPGPEGILQGGEGPVKQEAEGGSGAEGATGQ